MLKTAKHAAHLRQDLLHFVCLCNTLRLYSNFMQSKCIYEMQKKRPEGRFLYAWYLPRISSTCSCVSGWVGSGFSLPLRRGSHQVDKPSQPNL